VLEEVRAARNWLQRHVGNEMRVFSTKLVRPNHQRATGCPHPGLKLIPEIKAIFPMPVLEELQAVVGWVDFALQERGHHSGYLKGRFALFAVSAGGFA
jgi:hypothetical protein